MVTLDFPFGASGRSVAVVDYVEYPAVRRLELRLERKRIGGGLSRVCWYASRT